MTPWAFAEYVTEGGVNLIRNWYANQGDQVRAEFDVTVAVVRETRDWLEPEVEALKLLTGKHGGLGLGEIRFWIEERAPRAPRTKRRRFRVPGIYRPTQREFILILGCEKFGMNTVPVGAFDLAAKYKKEFDDGRGWTHEHF